MNISTNGKAPASSERKGLSNQNQIDADDIEKRFDVFNYAENAGKAQAECALCNPQIAAKPHSTVILCPNCAATQNRLEADILTEISRPRKVVRLHRCTACQNPVVPAKFSRDWGICKSCVADILSKSKLARSNFVERAVNNFRKMLRGVAAL